MDQFRILIDMFIFTMMIFYDLFYNLNCNDNEKKGIKFTFTSINRTYYKVIIRQIILKNQYNVVLQGACRFVESSIEGTLYDYGMSALQIAQLRQSFTQLDSKKKRIKKC